jgi:glutaconyl-CoA/methylmalonyl-CoA decarboxylase subunit gamma
VGRRLLAKYFLRLGEREVEAELEDTPEGARVNIDGTWHNVSLQRLGDSPRVLLVIEDRLLEVLVTEEAQAFNLQIGGQVYEVETTRRRTPGRGDQGDQFIDGRWLLRAPLTGVVAEIRVSQGDQVERGDVLFIVEAMKMLNELRARVSGIVETVRVEERQRVEIGQPLIEIREEPT